MEGTILYRCPAKSNLTFVPIIDPGRPDHHRDWVALYEIPEHIAQLKSEIWPLEQQRAALEAKGQAISQADSFRLNTVNLRLAELWHLDLSAANRTLSPTIERFYLPVFCADRNSRGHALAPCRRSDEFLCVLRAHSGSLLSAADAE